MEKWTAVNLCTVLTEFLKQGEMDGIFSCFGNVCYQLAEELNLRFWKFIDTCTISATFDPTFLIASMLDPEQFSFLNETLFRIGKLEIRRYLVTVCSAAKKAQFLKREMNRLNIQKIIHIQKDAAEQLPATRGKSATVCEAESPD
ncbi:MAG: hypothetical protein GY820_27830 [Gammaproteobacteria bacterium]|nr:hypothetical protein [Gammaproteobacteria bacterium]